ncbi:translation initiation factor IF-2 N-terminal domain-containing protein [Pseudoclavibacter helvolus]|uniref:Translation initiation factor IF-2 N-terminal domain-containing protein n=1 Tax=Pseudoclavibacter helvolus TaxID=255205 RepID=A0A7W4USD0_9MICO|nr:translation initiation factor IF-2 N-terminal domain-containing protein [Pseudoclavibacter helvolus]MBB2959548.1 hypothetical protein [Pseudoclavibacter helvolus]
MPKTRVHQLASELGIDSRTIMQFMSHNGFFVKSASSSIESSVEKQLRKLWSEGSNSPTGFPGIQPVPHADIEHARTLSWTPQRMPANIDIALQTLLRFAADTPSVALLRKARRDSALSYFRYGTLPELIQRVPNDEQLSRTPRSGIAWFEDGQRLLYWHKHIVAIAPWGNLVTATPMARVTSLLEQRGNGATLVHAISSLTHHDVHQSLATVPLPTHQEQNPSPTPPGTKTPAEIVLAYRPLSSEATEQAGNRRRRRPEHRWPVSAHQRQQWYPREQTHKTIWIKQHTSGSRDAPFLQAERVFVTAAPRKPS